MRIYRIFIDFILFIKLIAETIAAISVAYIVFLHLIRGIPRPIKIFFLKTISLFFKGTMTDDKKRVRGFKALKIHKEHQMHFHDIIETLAPDIRHEEILILDKAELLRPVSESSVFKKETYIK